MTAVQVMIFSIFAVLGVALIVFGAYAWNRPQIAAGARRIFTGLAPASMLFGVSALLLVANLVVKTLSDYEDSLRWWFLPPGDGGALDGMLRDPVIGVFILAIIVLFWWPADRRSPARVIARLRDRRTRAAQLWELARVLVTIVVAVLVVVLGFAVRLNGLLVIVLLWAAGLAAWWAFGRVWRKPHEHDGVPEKPEKPEKPANPESPR